MFSGHLQHPELPVLPVSHFLPQLFIRLRSERGWYLMLPRMLRPQLRFLLHCIHLFHLHAGLCVQLQHWPMQTDLPGGELRRLRSVFNLHHVQQRVCGQPGENPLQLGLQRRQLRDLFLQQSVYKLQKWIFFEK